MVRPERSFGDTWWMRAASFTMQLVNTGSCDLVRQLLAQERPMCQFIVSALATTVQAAATLGQEISVTEAETMLSFAHEESGRAESARHLTLAQFVGLAARLADAQAHR